MEVRLARRKDLKKPLVIMCTDCSKVHNDLILFRDRWLCPECLNKDEVIVTVDDYTYQKYDVFMDL